MTEFDDWQCVVCESGWETEENARSCCSNSKGKTYKDDPIVLKVLQRVKERSTAGMKSYGVPMTRPDVTTIEWLRHAQEEALDLAVYLERVISDLEEAETERHWAAWLP